MMNINSSASYKIVSLETAKEHVTAWHREGLKVGFTPGCFDLLHPGHVWLLDQARRECDKLIVALNSDQSVKRLKGILRSIMTEIERAIMLASLMTHIPHPLPHF